MTGTDVDLPKKLKPAYQGDEYVTRLQEIKRFTETLIERVDWGQVDGVDKPTLYKAGAEKILQFFGLCFQLFPLEAITTPDVPFWLYRYEMRIYLQGKRTAIANGIGSCNSHEKKYRWRWVSKEYAEGKGYDITVLATRGGKESQFNFAIEEKKTGGQYGKPLEYWLQWDADIAEGRAIEIMKKSRGGAAYRAWERDSTEYRVPNEDVLDAANTGDKMAQKRAFVAAVLFLGFSEHFTQDVGDDTPDDENEVVVSVERVAPVALPAPVEVPAENSTVQDDSPATFYQCKHGDCFVEIPASVVEERHAALCEAHYENWLDQWGGDDLYFEVKETYARARVNYTFGDFCKQNGITAQSTNRVLLDALWFFQDNIANNVAAT